MKTIATHWATAIALLFGVLSLPSYAADAFNTGLPIGKPVPALHVLDTDGKPQTLNSLKGETGLILVFFRSADWCPYCKRHLIEINDWVKPLEAKGYRVAAVSYDGPSTLKKFSDAEKLLFPLLSDTNATTVKNYHVLNTDYTPKDDNYGIPFPGAYIISKEGTVTFKYFYEGYKKRVTLETITKALATP